MLTDCPPRKANRAGFHESERIKTLNLPQDGRLLAIAKSLESAMKEGENADVRRPCAEFVGATSHFYKVPDCGIRVLAARPLRVRESWATELFGDYNPETMLIRVWMRTAVRREMTSLARSCARSATSSATTLTSRVSDSRIRDTLAASMSAPPRFTTMRGERHRNDCSGCQ
jgi:hypothetical protein